MNILIIAPHQDDEILAAGGIIQKCVKLKDVVTVLFATNGDYHGPQIAQKRYYESRDALSFLGIDENNIFYLGYGDTGMRSSHSFLRQLLFENSNTTLTTPFSSTTYHPVGYKTVHAIRTGLESPFTREAFLADIEWFLKKYTPDIAIAPNVLDQHGDHAAIIPLLQKINIENKVPIFLTYIIHGGDDRLWPSNDTNIFTCPPVIPTETWKNRISIPLTITEQYKKNKAILTFRTQLKDDLDNFLISFAKQEENFFLLSENEIIRQKIYNHFEYRENP